MGLTNDWQRKNKKKRGTTNVAKLSGEDSTFDINVGSGNLLAGKGVDKRSRMLSMRNNITLEDKELLYDILKQNSSEMLLFEALRENNFPLEYLVALGLTTEEDVQTYNVMKQRGVDINKYINENDGDIDIDSKYISEIRMGETTLPKLKKLDGTVVKEFSGGRGVHLNQGLTYDEKQEYENIKEKNKELEDRIRELEKELSGNGEENERSEDELLNNAMSIEKNEDTDESDNSDDLLDLIGNIGKGTYENRDVYIIGKNRGLTYSGYNIYYTTDINNIVKNIEGTGNLLVITNYIKRDRKFLSSLSKWLQKIANRKLPNTLIVSERGSKIHSSAIDCEITLDKKGLDKYFKKGSDSY